jgi:urease accessory protein UreH
VWQPVAAEQVLPGAGRWAASTVELRVAPGGRFLWAARPTIPHRGARLRRRVRVRAAEDAWVALEEWATAGRIGMGERWDDVAWDWVTDVAWGGRRWQERVRGADSAAADGAEAVWSLWLVASPELAAELTGRVTAAADVYAACVPLAPGAALARALGAAPAVAGLADAVRAWLALAMLGDPGTCRAVRPGEPLRTTARNLEVETLP